MEHLNHYSSSDSDSDEPNVPVQPLRKRKLPPVAPELLDKFAKSPRISTSDIPAMNRGNSRSKSFLHASKFWHSFCFLEWTPTREQRSRLLPLSQHLTSYISNTKTRFSHCEWQSNLINTLGSHLPLHVSLSDTLLLKNQQPETFIKHIRQGLRELKVVPDGKGVISNEISIRFNTQPKVYTNQFGNKLFLAIALDGPSTEKLARLADIIDIEVVRLLKENNDALLKPLRRSYHVSLDYCILDEPITEKELAELNDVIGKVNIYERFKGVKNLPLFRLSPEELDWKTSFVKVQNGRLFCTLDIGKVSFL
ncbi:hypothetical protein BABINDRAFT_159459 [Babjeviella inositovora NRRL Y-12698]|uniref:U6 snRNA phosphodiesterase 1 n=1 Tax=Babjeviella inositovora NRRL Y-12698 TaxID=984486 RepID=A0A1E3QZ84_9ASCO|nr:uncharacterized protein BABINDRAFT_159459 [Babjeviella inositovora NRRL Y-12698]ODQ82980.1 hypothetical protein BABINDRAFT_159459 [Babjeviella inositovora NRRL Y-12698]